MAGLVPRAPLVPSTKHLRLLLADVIRVWANAKRVKFLGSGVRWALFLLSASCFPRKCLLSFFRSRLLQIASGPAYVNRKDLHG
jgi:hypothetical protein